LVKKIIPFSSLNFENIQYFISCFVLICVLGICIKKKAQYQNENNIKSSVSVIYA